MEPVEGSSLDSLEELKHRYRVREIILDKGILAVIFVGLAVVANARLESHKTSLQHQLDDLRASRERQRVLAEREIVARETVWKSLIEMRQFIAPYYGKPLDESAESKFTEQVFSLSRTVEGEALYLEEALQLHIDSLVGKTLPEFLVNWDSSPKKIFTSEDWASLSTTMESIGREVRGAIYKRRQTLGEGLPSS